MSYPFRPHPTYGELFEILKKFKVDLCGHPGCRVEVVDPSAPSQGGADSFDLQYLHRSGFGPLGIVMSRASVPITWQKTESVCSHFNIPAEEFGLTNGWPPPFADPGE